MSLYSINNNAVIHDVVGSMRNTSRRVQKYYFQSFANARSMALRSRRFFISLERVIVIVFDDFWPPLYSPGELYEKYPAERKKISSKGFIIERCLEYSPKHALKVHHPYQFSFLQGAWKRAIFSNNFLFLDFPMKEDVLQQKYIRLKIFSIKFSTKMILIVEAVNTTVDALRARKKESYYPQSSKKSKFQSLLFFFFCLANISQEK